MPGDELRDQSRKIKAKTYIEGDQYLTQVFGDDAESVKKYLLTILESPEKPWREYRDLKRRYVDLKGEKTFTPQTPWDTPLVPLTFTVGGGQDGDPDQPVPSVKDFLAREHRFALLGDPGAGKSTTLKVLLVDAAAACLQDVAHNPLPVYLRLGAWPEGVPTLRDWVRRFYEDQYIRHPMGRDLLLLLDGLNEMGGGPELRAARVESIAAFLREYEGVRVILTCRARDYADDWDRALKLPRLTAQPLDDEHIQLFLHRYIPDPARADELWRKIQPEMYRKERALLELARNPYLLAILAEVYRLRGALPENNAQLFGTLVATRWTYEAGDPQQTMPPENHQVRGFTFVEFNRALGELAFCMIDKDKGTSVDHAWAREVAADVVGERAAAMLEVGEACTVLAFEGGDRVRFFHQLMQEYFAARALDWRGDELPRLARGYGWMETLLTRAGMGSDAQMAVLEAYLTALRDEDEEVHWRAASALSTIGETAMLSLLAALHDEDERVRWSAAAALMGIGKAAVPGLLAALRDEEGVVRWRAAQALGGTGDTRAVPDLIEDLSDTAKPYKWSGERVCDVAAAALRKIGTPEALAALRARGFGPLLEE